MKERQPLRPGDDSEPFATIRAKSWQQADSDVSND
jgi:hypothetical protein